MACDTCHLFDDIQLAERFGSEGQGSDRETGCALFDDVHALTGQAAPECMVATVPAAEAEIPPPSAQHAASVAPDVLHPRRLPALVQRAARERQGENPKRRGARRFPGKIAWQAHTAAWSGRGGRARPRRQDCGQPNEAGSWTAKGAIFWLATVALFPEPSPMSCLSPSAFKDGRSEPAGQGALVPTRGGHFVTSGARFALALLEGRPVTILMDGPAAGTQARLSKTGLGRLGSIWDRTFDDGSDESDADRPGVADRGRGHDLAEGEARLRDVMQTILEDSRPQILAQIARDAPGQRSARLNGITVPVLERRICRTKDDCLDGLAPVLEGGQLCKPPPNWAGRVDFLTAGLGSELRGKMTKGRPVAHLVLAPPGRGKTRSAQRLIEALPGEAVVWVFQPTLRKAHQFAQDMAASARPIRVFRGRGAPVAEGGARICPRHRTGAEVTATGLSIKRMLCGIDDQSEGASVRSSRPALVRSRSSDRHAGRTGGAKPSDQAEPRSGAVSPPAGIVAFGRRRGAQRAVR